METHIRDTNTLAKTPTVAEWANNNRSRLITVVAGLLVGIVVLVAAVAIFNSRSSSAEDKFGAAMRVYDTPVQAAGLPPGTEAFSSDNERAQKAFAAFKEVADSYGMTTAGKNAKYMAGVAAVEMGQSATGEALLKESADSWCNDRASLAKLALAHLYRQTGRDAEAIDTLKKIADKPSTVVPAGLAQMQLADLYEAENKPEEAKKVYAQLKDKDGKSPAGEMAAQKLAGPSPSPMAMQQ